MAAALAVLKLAGVITAGGASRRFGSDKALFEFDGRRLLDRVAESLAECAPKVLIAEPGKYDLPGWRAVPDQRPGEGPLAGLETALHEFEGWCAFAAVDLPHLSPALWTRLWSERGGDECTEWTECEIVCPLDADGRPQPLAALYHARLADRVTALLNGGERRVTALLHASATRYVSCGDTSFANFNERPA